MKRILLAASLTLTPFIALAGAQVASPAIPPTALSEQAGLNADAGHCEKACAQLQSELSSRVFFAKFGNFAFWDAKQQVTPACRVEPASAQDVVVVLNTVKEHGCHFAVKSGGHARFAGASNADGGVTIDLVRLDEIGLAADKKSVRIGAGNRWGRIYRKLEGDKLTVVGGRVATVGVGGATLGGGISFFTGRHGFACDNVLSYEIVLPSGEITTVSETQHGDLFKALKGAGSGNFGIITSFNLTTIPLTNPLGIWSSQQILGWDKVPALRKARLEWVTKGVNEDFDTGGFDVFGYSSAYNMSMAVIHHLHTRHSSTETWPAVFKQYKDIETLPMENSNSQKITPMSEVTEELAKNSPNGKRNTYDTFTYRPTEDLDAALWEIFTARLEKVKHIPGFNGFMVLQPISQQARYKMSLRGGNSLGLKESDGPLVIYQQAWMWDRAEDDALIFATVRDIVEQSEQMAKKMGLWHPYKYINYAEEWQAGDVYKGYGEDNLRTLKALQRRLDPEGVFTEGGLGGGYFRLNAKVENGLRDRNEL
ncbi:Proteasome subunit alpha type-4 [Venturia nashicola]|nr:Proteasome subunit alpha type-4 [Venturia nashicola]